MLGTAQAFIGGIPSAERLRWIGATAAGLAAGLPLGAGAVAFGTAPADLAAMGAITGAFVGVAQAAAVPMRVLDRILWATATPVLWAAGWLITSQVIFDADRHHAVFGSSGAVVVSALAGILYALRRRDSHPTAVTDRSSTGSPVSGPSGPITPIVSEE